MKIKRLLKNGKCFSKKSAGTILGCYIFNGNTERLEHDWNGCICKRCGKTRDEQHDWEYYSYVDCSYYPPNNQWHRCYGATCPCEDTKTVNKYRCQKCGVGKSE